MGIFICRQLHSEVTVPRKNTELGNAKYVISMRNNVMAPAIALHCIAMQLERCKLHHGVALFKMVPNNVAT
jgi:hypothetical protein